MCVWGGPSWSLAIIWKVPESLRGILSGCCGTSDPFRAALHRWPSAMPLFALPSALRKLNTLWSAAFSKLR